MEHSTASAFELLPDSFFEKFSRVEHLWRCIEPNTPPESKLHRAFKRIIKLGCSAVSHADEQYIGQALQAFDALPAVERQRILNGWTAEAPAGERMDEGASHLVIDWFTDGPSACLRWIEPTGINQVHLCIELGTTKAAALAAINDIRQAVENRWDDLITDPYGTRDDATETAEEWLAV